MLRQHEHFKLVSIFVVLRSDTYTHSCTSETRCQYLSVTCLPPPQWASAHCLRSLPAWHLVCINYVIVSNCQSKTIYMITHHLPFIGGNIKSDSNPSVPISFKLPTAVKLCLISMFTWVYVCEKLSYVTYQIWLIWFGLRLNPLFIPSFPPPLPRPLSPSFLSDRASLWSSCVVLPLLALTWMSAVLAITDRRSTLFQVMCLTTPVHATHSSVALRHHGKAAFKWWEPSESSRNTCCVTDIDEVFAHLLLFALE